MRRDIEFDAEGTTLRGWLVTPDAGGGPFPTVVMAHGFSAVKEMFLDRYAERFADAGVASIVYDNRNFGASDGQPRQEIDPWAQVRDYRHALTFATTLAEVDAGRLGVGFQLLRGPRVGGGRHRSAGAGGGVPGAGHLRLAQRGPPRPRRPHRLLPGAVRCRPRRPLPGRAAAMVPVVAEGMFDPCALPTPDSWQWFTEAGRTIAPSWRNEVTLRSVEMLTEYEPGVYVPRISPTPLLMVIGARDHLTVADEALAAYNQALEPKRLLLVEGGHFDVYTEAFEQTAGAAAGWFAEHL
ncbi:MAG: alpha/beta hydrolase [Acidimicrobiales bacterium]